MTKTLGSIRRADCVEAEVVLASGVYLTFRLDPRKEATVRNLIEVARSRKGMRPRESILVDARVYLAAKRAVVAAILAHREKMRLPPTRAERRVQPRPSQLRLPF